MTIPEDRNADRDFQLEFDCIRGCELNRTLSRNWGAVALIGGGVILAAEIVPGPIGTVMRCVGSGAAVVGAAGAVLGRDYAAQYEDRGTDVRTRSNE